VPPATESASGVSATIEYAVRVLKVRDAIVCGHTDCGAMKAIFEGEHLKHLPGVKAWLENAGPSAKWLAKRLSETTALAPEQRLRALTEANVLMQVQNLRAHPAVAEALSTGTLNVHGWLYEIGDGVIQAFDWERGMFRPLLEQIQDAAAANENERKIA